MAKSYPFIDVRCHECANEIRIPLEYESDRDKWTRADYEAMVYFPKNHSEWHLSDGMRGPDYCPLCRVTRVVDEEEKESENKCETDENNSLTS
jgi:hypothetical protein